MKVGPFVLPTNWIKPVKREFEPVLVVPAHKDMVKKIKALINEDDSEWFSIKEIPAPKNKTIDVWGFVTVCPSKPEGRWPDCQLQDDGWYCDGLPMEGGITITHWRNVPKPPNGSQHQGGSK